MILVLTQVSESFLNVAGVKYFSTQGHRMLNGVHTIGGSVARMLPDLVSIRIHPVDSNIYLVD